MRSLSSLIYKVRDFAWDYPTYLFYGEKSLLNWILKIYRVTKPASTILTFAIIILGLVEFVPKTTLASISGVFVNKKIITEATLVRPDDYPQSFLPIFPSVNQIEKDISYIVFPTLVKLDSKGVPGANLVEKWAVSDDFKEYSFTLLDNIYWQDGEELDTGDVEFTVNLMKEYGDTTKLGELVEIIELEINDSKKFTIKMSDSVPSIVDDMVFGLLPEHLLKDLSPNELRRSDFNLHPIGYGAYEVKKVTDDKILLQRHDEFYKGTPEIANFEYSIYTDEDKLIEDVRLGRVHNSNTLPEKISLDLVSDGYFEEIISGPLYKRYWAIYMNQKSQTNTLLTDVNIRRALSLALDKEAIINTLSGKAESANGPIAPVSWAYNKEAKQIYDIEKAKELLETAGWKVIEGKNVRTKEDKSLTFELHIVDDESKINIANMIKAELLVAGVEIKIITHDINDLVNNVVFTKDFDLLLYGIETTIDPDHYKLWHSSQVDFPGLNISGYESTLIDGRTDKPRIDIMLENARTETQRDKRLELYTDIQDIISDEYPVIFLYYPKYTYLVNNRIRNIDLELISVPEERYHNIEEWVIE